MNKEEALNDFLNGLHLSIYNSSAYSKDHPFYIKSIKNFKEKIDILLIFLNPIKINITSKSLFMDGRYWDKLTANIELAQLFHLRKIEGIEIKEGVTLEELLNFINGVSRPKKEILRAGGIQKILNLKNYLHISAEELDYSRLFEVEGEESLDIWVYIFKEALEKQDIEKLDELLDNFERIIGKFRVQDFLEDEDLRQTLCNFLTYLQGNQKKKFIECTIRMFEWLLKYKDILQDKNLNKAKPLFKNLNEEEWANLLWNGILTNKNFDILSFKLFSRLIGKGRDEAVASSLLSKIDQKKGILKEHPEAVMRIQALLFASESQFISDAYRKTLSFFIEDISFEKELSFDHNLLRMCYHFMIIDLLDQERDKESLNLILEIVSQEWGGITKSRDFEYLKYLLDVLKKIKKENPSLTFLFKELDKQISGFIESIVWEEEARPELRYFIDYLEKASFGSDFYLAKIFLEKKVSPYGLKLFFRFFPTALHLFYQNLEQRKSDVEFLARIAESLRMVDSSLSGAILKYIFSFANEFVKVEVLKAMRELSEIDVEFLFSILRKRDFTLKKEALVGLIKDKEAKKEAIKMLLSIPNHFGIRNKIILENMTIIEEIELIEASSYLASLSKKKFFWNSDIKKKAVEILRKWNVR
jgi:hypothetical protein